MSHRLSTLLYQHRARRAVARAKREQVRERIARHVARRLSREARIQAEAQAIDDWLGEQAYQDTRSHMTVEEWDAIRAK